MFRSQKQLSQTNISPKVIPPLRTKKAFSKIGFFDCGQGDTGPSFWIHYAQTRLSGFSNAPGGSSSIKKNQSRACIAPTWPFGKMFSVLPPKRLHKEALFGRHFFERPTDPRLFFFFNWAKSSPTQNGPGSPNPYPIFTIKTSRPR